MPALKLSSLETCWLMVSLVSGQWKHNVAARPAGGWQATGQTQCLQQRKLVWLDGWRGQERGENTAVLETGETSHRPGAWSAYWTVDCGQWSGYQVMSVVRDV